MARQLKDIAAEALELPISARAELVSQLLDSLEDISEEESDALWAEEADRRYAGFKAGEIKATPAEEVFARLRSPRQWLQFDRFQREVEATVALIREHPEIGSPITKRARKFRVRKFKHKVIYIFDGGEIIVLAVAHHKRRPRYWRHRIPPPVQNPTT